ncbi:MAG: DUF3015 domain-containing protein [Bdellovibrionota bacterium]|nr:MAG: DUF3015 domain-containing protein [Bdellovibrionota bacterium]
MNKFFLALGACALIPASAFANNNVGSCGWGSKVFQGQSGIAPQVLAATTNGTSGNQTFAITSGTSGCTQEGTVTSSWQTAAFVDENMTKLARDMSRGEGESLDAFAALLGAEGETKTKLNASLKDNFAAIFPTEETTSSEALQSIKGVLAADSELSSLVARI